MGQHIPALVPRGALPPIIRSSYVLSTPPVEAAAYSIEGVPKAPSLGNHEVPWEWGSQESQGVSYGQGRKGGKSQRLNTVLTPSWRSSAIFVLLRGTVSAHAYLPNGFGYVSAGGPALESWAKARKLPITWTAGQSP